MSINRRELLCAAAGGAAAILGTDMAYSQDEARLADSRAASDSFTWHEATIAKVRAAIDSGSASCASIARDFLRRVSDVNPLVNAVIEVNSDALSIAQALDEEKKTKGTRGPL